MTGVLEYAVFGVLMALNFGLGLYFSLRRKARITDSTAEVFLGSRTLRSFPLAASLVASLISSVSLVGFTGHFYAYGFHLMWSALNTVAMAPVVAFLFLPVFYGLRVTSTFEYVRLRFNSTIALVACGIYLFFSLSAGAITIFAAGLTTVTIFGAPLLWCNILIGLGGTIYTALGGLRGVVWTDCVQLIFIILGPAIVIANVIAGSKSSIGAQQALRELDVHRYITNVEFDISHDENVWSSLLASTTFSLYRVGLDQVTVQRCMASRTLSDAKRTLFIGSFMLFTVYVLNLALALALVVWFWGCDPRLSGAINSHDQILPYYVSSYVTKLSGFTGLFVAAIVSAATSTISSIINSQAAVLYVDVLSPRFHSVKLHFKWVARCTAFLLGATMTLCSCACVYLGSITRIIIMVLSASMGPFVGLMILAIAFPFVHAKGAGISTLLLLGFQLVVMWQSIQSGFKPSLMPVTLDYCQENGSHVEVMSNATNSLSTPRQPMALFRLSSFWSCLISTCATVILGVMISVATGEHRKRNADAKHLNQWFLRFWQRLGLAAHDKSVVNGDMQDNADETSSGLLDSKGTSKHETTI
ncbi:sodium-coupled monocarboxylate transporter 2-like [Dermacentor andersoni]|uniref:sodium-coupled monocarboxylate transporter 2-like n=1 Tax=Dermacentor andersoni TaxID=34620 RepID=UPI0024179B2F|nr:sodium-coupled monocarboxylate transporter 2-like [Dermacentor andersoni]